MSPTFCMAYILLRAAPAGHNHILRGTGALCGEWVGSGESPADRALKPHQSVSDLKKQFSPRGRLRDLSHHLRDLARRLYIGLSGLRAVRAARGTAPDFRTAESFGKYTQPTPRALSPLTFRVIHILP